MSLIQKENYTTQVVKYLQHEIETGKLPPLSKLQGIRNLSKQFDVSQNVILSALKELESRRLIYREERKGIFVSEMASNPNMLEVLVLVFMASPANNAFVAQILKVLSSKSADGKINFYTRIVTNEEEKFFSPELRTRLLEAEIAKLSQTFHSDCALVIGPLFRKCDVKIAMQLPFPTLFVGNFKEEDFADLSYNRIGFKNNYFDDKLEFARVRGLKNIVLVEPDKVGEAVYHQEACRDFFVKAERVGIRVRRIPIQDARHPDTAVRMHGMEKTADEIAEENHESCLYLFNCVIDRSLFIRLLRERGIEFETGKREILVFPADEMDMRENWIHYSTISKDEIEKFNQYLCEKLQQLAENQLDGFIEDVSLCPNII